MEQLADNANLPLTPSVGNQSKSKSKIFANADGEQKLQELLERYPKHVHFLLRPPVPFWPRDRAIYLGLIELAFEQINIYDSKGLIYVRDFVLAEMNIIKYEELREQIVVNEQQTILRNQIERGLILERRPDHEIEIVASRLTKEYFEGHSRWIELEERFSVWDRHELEAAAFRACLLEVTRIESSIRNSEQRRDRALKNLAAFRKPEAERLRQLAHRLEQPDVMPPIHGEIAPPAQN